MKTVYDLTNEELIEIYARKLAEGNNAVNYSTEMILREIYDRYRFYVKNKKLPLSDTSYDVYRVSRNC